MRAFNSVLSSLSLRLLISSVLLILCPKHVLVNKTHQHLLSDLPLMYLTSCLVSVQEQHHRSWRQMIVEPFFRLTSGLQINLDWPGKRLRRLGPGQESVSLHLVRNQERMRAYFP